jgi:hypothetical protein
MSATNVFQTSDIDPEILAMLSASYGRKSSVDSDEIISRIVERNKPKSEKSPRKSGKAVAQAVGSDPRPALAVNALPKAGTLDAKAFLVKMRRASTRDEQIELISSYVGYDRAKDHGAQELAARMSAQRSIRGDIKPLVAPVNTAGNTVVVGEVYSKGTPDAMARRRADLQGREALAAEAMLDNEKLAKDANISSADRYYHGQLAIVERGRLAQIKRDLAAL